MLDDGWFTAGRSDTTSLGDWTVDAEFWPDGLGPLVDGVRALGMDFGLWFEPECVSPCPPWPRHTRTGSCRTPTRRGPGGTSTRSTSRNRTSRAYVLDRMSAVIEEHHVDFVKWDQNRDVVQTVHAGRVGLGAHTRGGTR